MHIFKEDSNLLLSIFLSVWTIWVLYPYEKWNLLGHSNRVWSHCQNKNLFKIRKLKMHRCSNPQIKCLHVTTIEINFLATIKPNVDILFWQCATFNLKSEMQFESARARFSGSKCVFFVILFGQIRILFKLVEQKERESTRSFDCNIDRF